MSLKKQIDDKLNQALKAKDKNTYPTLRLIVSAIKDAEIAGRSKGQKELNSGHHRFLAVFGKIPVIKTMCIPKFTHIATVIPNLSIGQIKEIEKEFESFLNENNTSVKDKMTRHLHRKD